MPTKEELEDRLAARRSPPSSRLNPIKSDGVNAVVAAQEIALLGMIFASPGGGWKSPASSIKAGRYDAVIPQAMRAFDPRRNVQAKIFWGATGIGLVANAVRKRGKKPIHAGLLKLN